MCLGNICRSPLAEAICKHKIAERGWEDLMSCDSAGTANYHVGEDPDHRSIRVASEHGIPISHKGQQFTKSLSSDFDYWIAMDRSNYQNMAVELGDDHENLLLMRRFDSQNPNSDVPDPYYGGQGGFESVYQILDRSIDALLDDLALRHELK